MTFGDHMDWSADTADLPRSGSAEAEPGTDVTRGHGRDTPVREDNTSTSGESGMSDCGSADGTEEPSADTDGDRSRGFLGRFLSRFHPPDIWEKDRPALAKLQAYARHGAGAPEDGPLRTGQIWWNRLVAFPITAWAHWKAWALERPFRGWPVLIAQVVWWVLNVITLAHLL